MRPRPHWPGSLRFFVVLALLGLVACGGDSPTAPTEVKVRTLSVYGSDTAVGGSAQFSAFAGMTDATIKTVTHLAAWQSSNAAVATVAAGGMVTGMGPGQAEISATYEGFTGKARITVTRSGPTLAAVLISGTPPSPGRSSTFNAVARYSDGTTHDVTAQASWRSSNTAVATVNAGRVSGVSAGETDLTATYQTVTGTLRIRVAASVPKVKSVTVSGTVPKLGTTSLFTATTTLSDGTRQDVTANATWSSSNTRIATVSAGLVKALAAGEADIKAVYQNVAGSLHVRVAAAAVTGLSLSGTAPAVGRKTYIHATATFSDGSTQTVYPTTWVSSNPAAATVDTLGWVSGVSEGETDITATYQGVSGTLRIRVAPAPTLTSLTIRGVAPYVGTQQRFDAIAGYSDGYQAYRTLGAAWSSSNPGVATVDTGTDYAGTVKGVAVGETDITAVYQGVSATQHISVAAPPPCTFTVSPTTFTIPPFGGSAVVTVSLATGTTSCRATVSSESAFLKVPSVPSSSSFRLAISVEPNYGAERTGTVDVAGTTVTILQSSSDCVTSLSPGSVSYPAETRTGLVTINAPASCSWMVRSLSSFVTLSSTATGTGPASVRYFLPGNVTGAARTGTLQAGSQTMTISQEAPLGGSLLMFTSQKGDYIGGGTTEVLEAPYSTFTTSSYEPRRHVLVRIEGSDGLETHDWTLDLAAPVGQQLQVGNYPNATRYPFQAATVPGLDFSGMGSGCNRLSGQFSISAIEYDSAGKVRRLHATFEQHCEGAGPALLGEIIIR